MWIDLSQKQGGDSIGRVLIIESSERNAFVIDEILNGLKKYSDFEFLWLQHNPVLSLPDMEIDPIHRKVCCGGQKLSLTAKEYDLLCLFAANKGRILTYDQIYEKIWKEKAFGNANNAIARHVFWTAGWFLPSATARKSARRFEAESGRGIGFKPDAPTAFSVRGNRVSMYGNL